MNTVTKKTSGLTTSFKVIVPSSAIAGKILSWLQEKSKYVRIDGFRPGKVPLNIISQRYGHQAKQDVLEETIKETTQKVLKEHSIQPALQPEYEIEPYEDGKDFSFSVSVDSMPEIQLKDFKAIKVEKLTVDIGETELENALQRLAERYTKFNPAAAGYKLMEGDQATVSLVCEDSKKKIIPSYSGDKIDIVVGKNEMDLGFIEEKLIGHKVGDTITVDHTFPKSHHAKAVAGKAVSFKVEITEIGQPEKSAKVDEEFAKGLGCAGLQDLKDRLNENLRKEHDTLAAVYHKRSILDALESAYKFELPARMIKVEFDNIWNHLQAEIAAAKEKGEYEDDGDQSEGELRAEYEKISERRVRLGLLIAEVAKVNNIRVSSEMIRNAIFKEAMKYPGKEKEVVAFYREHPQETERLTSPILEDLVVEHILSQSTQKEVKVTIKQLHEKLVGVLPGYDGEETDATTKTKSKQKEKSTSKVEKAEKEVAPKATKKIMPKKKPTKAK